MRIAALCFLFLLTGCATLFASGPDVVPVSTEPPGASVRLDGAPAGTTPCQLSIPRRSEAVITLELAGYKPKTVDLEKVVNGATWINCAWILVWPVLPIAFIVDWATGNIGKYPDKPIVVQLEKEP